MTGSERHVSRSVPDTESIGRSLASRLTAGNVVLLDGELGTGKTTFIRGLAEAIGGDADEVSSPSFVIIQSYRCGARGIEYLHHVDLYRLAERRADLREIGIEDILSDPDAVVAIEWPKLAVETWIPADARVWRVRLTLAEDEQRDIVIEPPACDEPDRC